jgi:hypothetical protein
MKKSNHALLAEIAETTHRLGSLKRQGVVLTLTEENKAKVTFKKMVSAKPMENRQMNYSYGL